MTDEATPPAGPINVNATATPAVMSETTKAILIAGFAFAAAQFIHSESALGVILASSGAIVTFAWNLFTRIRNWRIMRHLAGVVDDSVATVGQPRNPWWHLSWWAHR
jgi:hypothetical protein